METILISYDLIADNGVREAATEYEKLDKAVAALAPSGLRIRPLYSVWLVRTALGPFAIRAALEYATDKNDRLIIASIPKGQLAAKVLTADKEWVETNT